MKPSRLREVLALGGALVLWYFVRTTNYVNSTTSLSQMQITVPLQVRMGPRLTVYHLSQETARVTIQGDSQAVASLREQQVSALLDLTREDGLNVYTKVQVIVPGVVQMLDVDPAFVNVLQAAVGSRQCPVEISVSGEPASGRAAEPPRISPTTVTVTGPDPLLQTIDKVRGEVILDGQSQATSFVLRNLDPTDAVGQRVESRRVPLTLTPDSVSVTVPITSRSRSTAVPVALDNVRVTGERAEGARLQVKPEFVTLQVTRGIPLPEFVLTRPVSLDADDREGRDVALELPSGCQAVGRKSVRVVALLKPGATPAPSPTPVAP